MRRFVCAMAMALTLCTASAVDGKAERILEAAGVRGGLIVCLGEGGQVDSPGTFIASLRTNERTLVYGFHDDDALVETARRTIRKKGCYGPVSVHAFDGRHLPLVGNLANLVVAEDLGDVPMEEVMRVLAPLGVALIDGKKTVKPWPSEMDEWTHYLHGADNNAVANDTLVGPPKGMQWVNDPLWDRAHSTLFGTACIVSSRGRIFSIEDTAPIALPLLPGKYALIARDAFNGIVLWKRPFSDWENITHHMKGVNPQLTRRLVADGDRVFVTPGIATPVTAFRASDGELLRSYEGTEHTREILFHKDTLYLVMGDPSKNYGYESEKAQYPADMVHGERLYSPRGRFFSHLELDRQVRRHTIAAIDASTGRRIWEASGASTVGYEGTTLAVRGARLVFQRRQELVCLDRQTGTAIWSTPVESSTSKREHKQAGGTPTVVMTDDAVYRADMEGLVAYSLSDGRMLWRTKSSIPFGYHSSPDLFVANGAVWVQKDHTGYDLRTGDAKQIRGACRTGPMGHDRCFRNKATQRFVIEAVSGGCDFSSLGSEQGLTHPWIRGTCSLGVLPCNGLLYASPHACGCVNETTLNGFWAVTGRERLGVEAAGEALTKGAAFARVSDLGGKIADDDWPTYRCDMSRSGLSRTKLSPELSPAWQVKLDAAPGQPICVGGKVFVAASDAHTLYALDSGSGKTLWTFTTDGRIDTPPTWHRGLLLFGSRDGHVYCLRAVDGTLVWRFRAAPAAEHLACAFNQVESVWPVNGSILVLNDIAYVTAGWSTFLDGGIFMYGLDSLTGRVVHKRVLDGPYESGGDPIIHPGRRTSIYGNKNDILVSDGRLIYLSHWGFKPDLGAVEDAEQLSDHLVSGSSFLDDSRHHRSFWTSSVIVPSDRRMRGAAVPDGDLLVLDGNTIYGVRGYKTSADAKGFLPRENGYHLFSMTRQQKTHSPTAAQAAATRKKGKAKPSKPKKTYMPIGKHHYRENWTAGTQVSALAMVANAEYLFIAGAPNQFPEEDIHKAIEGRMGGVLIVASKEDGRELGRHVLLALPAWDAMAAARGQLLLSLENGTILCYR
jgi:outer membrane protein assembly factor BamB